MAQPVEKALAELRREYMSKIVQASAEKEERAKERKKESGIQGKRCINHCTYVYERKSVHLRHKEPPSDSVGDEGSHSDAGSAVVQEPSSEGYICLAPRRRDRCHRLAGKRTPCPSPLLQQAFEILTRGNH